MFGTQQKMATNQIRNKIKDNKKPSPEQESKREEEQAIKNKATIAERKKEQEASGEAAYQKGVKRGEELFASDTKGLRPDQKNALQYEANAGINRGLETANRKLLGEQGRRGIMGKSGVGYAQQRDLMRTAEEARQGADRDLTKLDADLALKKQAALYAGGSGAEAQDTLRDQLLRDEIINEEERRNNKKYLQKYEELFTRV
jgi:hypothetical protein